MWSFVLVSVAQNSVAGYSCAISVLWVYLIYCLTLPLMGVWASSFLSDCNAAVNVLSFVFGSRAHAWVLSVHPWEGPLCVHLCSLRQTVCQGGCDGYTLAGRVRAFLLLQSLAHASHRCSVKLLPFQGGSATFLCFFAVCISQGVDEVEHLFMCSLAIWRSALPKALSNSLPVFSFCLFLPDL